MAIDLRTQISEFVDGGTSPVSFGEIIGRPEGNRRYGGKGGTEGAGSGRRPPRPGSRWCWWPASSAGVVRRLDVELAGTIRVCHFKIRHTVKNGHVSVKVVQAPALQGGVTAAVSALRASVSASFVHIGQPEVITAPAHATNVYGHG
jgi:hypothetical protein